MLRDKLRRLHKRAIPHPAASQLFHSYDKSVYFRTSVKLPNRSLGGKLCVIEGASGDDGPRQSRVLVALGIAEDG